MFRFICGKAEEVGASVSVAPDFSEPTARCACDSPASIPADRVHISRPGIGVVRIAVVRTEQKKACSCPEVEVQSREAWYAVPLYSVPKALGASLGPRQRQHKSNTLNSYDLHADC